MNSDYSFFEETLTKVRRLRSRFSYPYQILDGATEVASGQPSPVEPKVIWKSDTNEDETIIETSNYAARGGTGLDRLRAFLGNEPPLDFAEFYRRYSQALVVTRSFPTHLWDESKIVEEAEGWRLRKQRPIRFFRFGSYFDHPAQHFGLWQEKVGSDVWRVVVTSVERNDDEYDTDTMDPIYILGPSFHEWLWKLVESDGVDDPFWGCREGDTYMNLA
jgi:hypothetical protein